jgi:nucleotide-binding universal stress UspA family protein
MVRIQHILCPVDFSDFSRHAFDCAVGMARNYGADVTVLHVLPVPSLVPALPYGPEGPGPFGFETVGRERALVELKQFLNLDSVGVPVHFRIAEGPSVHNEILLQTSRLSADLVVMGTHGRSGFDRLMLGSAAEKTLRASRVPVLIVPPRTPEAPAFSRDAFRHVLCAVDFSQDSARALGYAVSLARRAGGDLTLVHVVEPIPLGYDPMGGVTFDTAGYEKAVAESARRQLQQFIPEDLARTSGVDTVVTQGKAYREILRIASERDVDLIVLGVHGRNAMDRLVFGSTTEHVVRRGTCPVLTVPAPLEH